ncbi:glycosyltransferase [Halopseudomonas pelagia]|uniref:glycosyltransferase n=1 Tax=Halopseudomonas pelagia TaxID=553151 RepID=UPI0030DB4866|tara:strand:- start:589 stop:1362 length:774 start_codon:yes stop_codon:yes gene_type:complete
MINFSIVTITWNNLAGLQKTYESIARQKYRHYRWIVIDGASTDGSVEWLAQLNEPRAEITSEADKGIYDAMNKGLVQATETPGYTLFMNSGDRFYDDSSLQKVVQAVTGAAADPKYLYGDYFLESAEGKLTAAYGKSIDKISLGMPSCHQAMYFENAHLRHIRFRQNYQLSADYCMIIEFVRGLDAATQILHIRTPLCIFDMTGISQRRRFAALREDVHIRMQYLKLGATKAYGLYGLHFLHTHSKILRAALEKRLS